MKKEIIDANYAIVKERTLEIIATEIKMIDNHVRQVALSGVVEIGQKLEEAKERVGHGNWESWCRENLNYSKSQAEKFMKIATEYGDENSPYLLAISKTYTCTDFSISKAFKLLQVPEEDVETFADEHNIEDMTVKNLEAEIKRLKEEKENEEEQAKAYEELQKKLSEAEKEKEATYALLQELQEESLETNNNEQEEAMKKVTKLTADLEKMKANEKKLKEEKALLEKTKDNAISEAIEKNTEKIKLEAQEEAKEKATEEITKFAEEAEEANKRADAAESKLTLSASEDVIEFKVKAKDLQEIVRKIKEAIKNVSTNDAQQAGQMQEAFKRLMQTLTDGICEDEK